MAREKSGYILLHRKIRDNWLYKEKRKFSKFEAWIDILIACNHDEVKTIIKNKLFTVSRGESIRSLITMSDSWGWNKNSVKRFLDLLKSDGMIDVKNETLTTRIIVRNYSDYQSFKNADETQMEQSCNADETELERRRASSGNKQSINKTLNTPKAPNTPKTNTKEQSDNFENFWKTTNFPKRKQDTKGDMKKKYFACLKAGISPEDILFSSNVYAQVNQGNQYPVGMRRFLDPDTVKEYLTEDVTLKDEKEQRLQRLRDYEASIEESDLPQIGMFPNQIEEGGF